MSGFSFQHFKIEQDLCAMKVGTDGVLLGAWAAGGKHILDIGTGTGLIALMMAQRFTEAQITAIDINHNACLQTMENINNSPYKNRIKVIETSLQNLSESEEYDCIVSNPPFFVNSLKAPDKVRNTARHTDTLSYTDLFRCVARLLSSEGEFSVIIPTECINLFLSESTMFGFFVKCKYSVRTTINKGPKRYLISLSKQNTEIIDTQEVNLIDRNGNKSIWYKQITNAFYLK